MFNPLVSIVTPVYNAEKYLADAIDSVLAQTWQNWELILVDDGSTDSSYAIAQSFTDSRIKLFKQTNKGQCGATNTGLKHITGDYVLFFDADDLLDPNKIEAQMKDCEHFPNSVGVGRFAFFRDTIEDAKFTEEPVYISTSSLQWLYLLWSYETMMPNNGYLIPRTVLDKAGIFYDEELLLNIDFEYFTRVVLAAESVVYSADSICYYRKSVAGSKTQTPNIKKSLSALNARYKSARYLLAKDDTASARHAARMAITILTYSFPSILKDAKMALTKLGLERFGKFGGKKFRLLTNIVGYENAIRIKERLDK